MPPTSKTSPGNVFEIPLEAGGFAYGMVIKVPLVAFFDFRAEERPELETILGKKVAFRVWIMNSALGRSGWKIIGSAPVPPRLTEPAVFYKFDVIARRFSLYEESVETPATREQCIGLECAAVWSATHIESRLADHFAGRSNRFLESMDAARRQ